MIHVEHVKSLCEADILTDIICNSCGTSCIIDPGYKMFSYAEISASWGFGSAAPWDNPEQMSRDGEYHRAHLCQPCYELLIKDWKIKPETRNCLHNEPQFVKIGHDADADPIQQRKDAKFKPVDAVLDVDISEFDQWISGQKKINTATAARIWLSVVQGYKKINISANRLRKLWEMYYDHLHST